jgi:putative peptidoglycan lipid II flippase
LFASATLLAPYLAMATIRYLALLALVLIGMISYFSLGHLLGAFKLSELKRNLRR